jgi:cytochrome c-type biogenesis protein CcmH
LLLADCPSPAAFDLRADIRKRLDAGESAADIERELYYKYGDAIRAVPPARGWGRVLWVAPAVILVLSFAALAWFLARSRAQPESPPEPNRDAALEDRLNQELDEVR